MTKQEVLNEIERIKNESRTLQSELVKELKLLESEDKSVENRRRMAEISVLHAKDLSDTFDKVWELEKKFNLL